MLRTGIQESIAPELLQDFTREVELVRIADELEGDVEIDMWIAPINLKIARRQLPHFRGLRVVQSLMAGVDRLQQLLPSGLTLCDAKGVHDAPTAGVGAGGDPRHAEASAVLLLLAATGGLGRPAAGRGVGLVHRMPCRQGFVPRR